MLRARIAVFIILIMTSALFADRLQASSAAQLTVSVTVARSCAIDAAQTSIAVSCATGAARGAIAEITEAGKVLSFPLVEGHTFFPRQADVADLEKVENVENPDNAGSVDLTRVRRNAPLSFVVVNF